MADSRPLIEMTKWRVREFIREPEAVFWVFAFPILMAVALGIAFKNRGVQDVTVYVREGPEASALADALSEYPGLVAEVAAPDVAANALRTGRVPVVVIPGDPVTLRFDSTRTESQFGRLRTADALQRVAGRQDVMEVREERVTEPGARYIDFLIPGLLGMNIMGTGVWGVGFGIAQTRQRKLLKRLLASPMRRRDFLLGQMMARMVFLVVEVTVVVLFGILAFGVPFRGSPLSVALLVVVGAFTFAGLGALIASRVQTLEGVSGLMNVVLMPMWVLSGVFFSYSRFPEVIHPFIRLLPLTALNDSLRAVMLDGAGLSSTLMPLTVMSVWCVACVTIALKIFRWN